MPYEVIFEDLNFLSDIYALQQIHFNIIKENIRAQHMYRVTQDSYVLTEGFTDILNSMGDFFKKAIEKIKEFFRKAFMYINSYFMELDKFVSKYKRELDSIKKVDFIITGFEFTLHDIPNMDPFQKVVDEYNSSLSDAAKMKKD